MLQFIQRNPIERDITLHKSKLMNQLLLSRGFQTQEEADSFLNPRLENLYDPFLFRDMKSAINIIQQAIANRHKIVVFGDYDCDGVCATTIITKALRIAGAEVNCWVPSREDGYGLNTIAIYELSKEYQVLITVDLGISNIVEIELAKSLGLKVIISDHHQLPDIFPNADAILHPAISPYPFSLLCGAGVAFKIACALVGEKAYSLLDFAAIATIGDIVPLINENRVIVKYGLEKILKTENIGLKILINLAAMSDVNEIKSEDVAFRLVPRINAAGRMDSAKLAVDLFQTEEEALASELAKTLDDLNHNRKSLENEIFMQALKQVEDMDFSHTKFIVVSGKEWHHGVIGLVAGKLCERFHLPVAAFTVSEKTATASIRSIPGINIYYFLKKCEDLFIKWGGHEQAAGLTLLIDNLDVFKDKMNEHISKEVDTNTFIRKYIYDLETSLEDITLETYNELSKFNPTGEANPSPIFLSSSLNVVSARTVGANSAHLKLSVEQNSAKHDGIFFGGGSQYNTLSKKVDCIYSVDKNVFMGVEKEQLMIKSIRNTKDAEIDLIRLIGQDVIDAAAMDFFTKSILECLKINDEIVTEDKFAVNDVYGNLVLSYNKDNAIRFYTDNIALFDFDMYVPQNRNGQNTILLAPDLKKIPKKYNSIVCLDSIYCQEQIDYLMLIFPSAKIYVMQNSIKSMREECDITIEQYRALYIYLLKQNTFSLETAAASVAMTRNAVLYAINVFQNLNLLSFDFQYQRITMTQNPKKCDIESNVLVRLMQVG